ncbi:MAG: hypothetical protein Kow00120_21060 [Anaerolineae bacterium]
MRVLMLVQQIDAGHWLRGFIVNWVRALAQRVDHLDVITLELGEAALPANVFVQSMGKERGFSRPHELWAFHRAITRVIRDVDVVFSHMTPRYTLVAAPYAMRYRKPQVLWFTHRTASAQLRLAMALCRRVVTAVPDSVAIPGPKVTAIGHGIDADLFAPARAPAEAAPPQVVMVARLAPSKHYRTMIRAAAQLRDEAGMEDVRFVAVGGETPEFPGHRAELEAEVARLGLGHCFRFTGGMPYSALPALYHRSAVALNLSPPGHFDKAALEAMLCAKPIVVANPAYTGLLGAHAPALLLEDPEDAGGLAARLAALLAAGPAARAAIGADLRRATYAAHSLDGLMDRLAALLREVAGQ